MLQALAGEPAPEELVRAIDRETEAPVFVEGVYLHLAESGCCSTAPPGAA